MAAWTGTRCLVSRAEKKVAHAPEMGQDGPRWARMGQDGRREGGSEACLVVLGWGPTPTCTLSVSHLASWSAAPESKTEHRSHQVPLPFSITCVTSGMQSYTMQHCHLCHDVVCVVCVVCVVWCVAALKSVPWREIMNRERLQRLTPNSNTLPILGQHSPGKTYIPRNLEATGVLHDHARDAQGSPNCTVMS
jgi:hypothetical protein